MKAWKLKALHRLDSRANKEVSRYYGNPCESRLEDLLTMGMDTRTLFTQTRSFLKTYRKWNKLGYTWTPPIFPLKSPEE